ncbi:MAG: hypothetical protein HQL67_08925 [Magnetococcales bacterium]|nr:hypothetical protein [Magnetococcales bacterium]
MKKPIALLNQSPSICAIDFGSKNFKFVVGRQIGVDIEVDLLKKEPMGLGQDLLDHDGSLSEAKLGQIKTVLSEFKDYCDSNAISTILGIGTSAIRSAKNQEQASALIRSFGIIFEVAQGKREGQVSYLAVTNGAPNQLVSDMGSRSFQYAYKLETAAGGTHLSQATDSPGKNKEDQIINKVTQISAVLSDQSMDCAMHTPPAAVSGVKEGESIESFSLKSGYLLAFAEHFERADTFADARRSFRRQLKRHIESLPKKTDIYIALASNTMAAYIAGGAKLDVVNQFLWKKVLLGKIDYLKELKRHDYKLILHNTPKINKIFPGLVFVEYMLEHSGHDKVLIAEAELPAGLIVEHFLKTR